MEINKRMKQLCFHDLFLLLLGILDYFLLFLVVFIREYRKQMFERKLLHMISLPSVKEGNFRNFHSQWEPFKSVN